MKLPGDLIPNYNIIDVKYNSITNPIKMIHKRN